MAVAKQERIVSYFYDEEIGNFCYGGGNPMRPHRARLVYSLLKSYGLSKNMMVHRPEPRSFDQLTEFHADDYIDFLRTVTPLNAEDHLNQLKRFNMGQIGDVDCPVFDGVYEYCQLYAGGSVNGAAHLAAGQADIAFNWSGGMHHAKKAEASGFCFVNDIVLGILELLKVFSRVLYVDIDIHHGDGVEEAFYLTDRVMTVSFHKYGEFFPGTGALADVGYNKGKYYTVNVPLKDGMDDDNYQMMFEPIMSKVMEMYQPGAVVMCCGADSLSGDKLGCFNLSMEGHSHCIEFLAKYQVPMLVLGGGGYTLRNVARCWCFETGRIMGVDLPDELPEHALHEYNYYLDTGSLRISVSNMKNMNTKEELMEIKRKVLEHLSQLPPVPSSQMAYRPGLRKPADLPEEDPDVRGGGPAHDDWRRQRAGEESDEEEGSGRARRNRTPNRTPPPSPPIHGAAPGTAAAAVPIKQEPLHSALQAATLMTSEALQGPGIQGGSGGGAARRSPGRAHTPLGQSRGGTPPPSSNNGPAPMETDPLVSQPPPPHAGSSGGAAADGGCGGTGGAVAGARDSGMVVGGSSMPVSGAYVGGSSGGAAVPGGAMDGVAGLPPSISMLGPSSGLSQLGGSSGGAQPPIKTEMSPTAAGAVAGMRPNIIGASWDPAAGPAVGSPRTAANATEGGGIYRPQ